MGSANERRRYYVRPSLIGRAPTQNDPCNITLDCIQRNNDMGKTYMSQYNRTHKRHSYLAVFKGELWGAIVSILGKIDPAMTILDCIMIAICAEREMQFWRLAAMEDVKMTTYGAVSDENVKMTAIRFEW